MQKMLLFNLSQCRRSAWNLGHQSSSVGPPPTCFKYALQRATRRLPLSPCRIKVGSRLCHSLPASKMPTGGSELQQLSSNKMELPSGRCFCLAQRDQIWWEPETWHCLQFSTSKQFFFFFPSKFWFIYLSMFIWDVSCSAGAVFIGSVMIAWTHWASTFVSHLHKDSMKTGAHGVFCV